MAASEIMVREACRDDLAAVLGVQHRAFGRVVAQFDVDPAHMPPITEGPEDLERLFDCGMRFFVAVAHGNTVIGSVRGANVDDVVEVGRLVVDDGWTRQGVATALMNALEAAFPQARAYSLFTADEAREPLALYAKLGYVPVRYEDQGLFTLVWLEKPGPSAED